MLWAAAEHHVMVSSTNFQECSIQIVMTMLSYQSQISCTCIVCVVYIDEVVCDVHDNSHDFC